MEKTAFTTKRSEPGLIELTLEDTIGVSVTKQGAHIFVWTSWLLEPRNEDEMHEIEKGISASWDDALRIGKQQASFLLGRALARDIGLTDVIFPSLTPSDPWDEI